MSIVIIFSLLCAGVPLLAIAAFWPRRRVWLVPLLAFPWIRAGLSNVVESLYTSAIVMPAALAVLLPLLAVVVDRWQSLRARAGFWIGLAVIAALVGWYVWGASAGELGLNHDDQYCTESTRFSGDCKLDPILVANVYLTAFGLIGIAGSIPALVLFAILAYRRWSGHAP